MNVETKSNNQIYIIGGIIIFSIIFIIVSVVVYLVFYNDSNVLGTSSTNTQVDTPLFTPETIQRAIDENNRRVAEAQALLEAEGLDGIVDFSEPPGRETTSVEIEGASGTKTVSICNNEGCRPMYFNKHLTCSNGMKLISDAGQNNFCCSYDDINQLEPVKQNFVVQHLSEFMEYTHDPANFKTTAIMGLIMTDLMTIGATKQILKGLTKSAAKAVLKPLLGNMVSQRAETFTKAMSKFNIVSKLTNSEAAQALGRFKTALIEGIEDAARKGFKEVAGKEFKEFTEKGAAKLVKSTFRTVGQLIPGLNVIMDIEMAFEFVGWVLEQYDVGGFKQYQDNKLTILAQRDLIQGMYLYNFKVKGVEAPLYFNLYNLGGIVGSLESESDPKEYIPSHCPDNNTTESSMPRITKINILKDISATYKAAFTSYHHSLGGFKKNLTRNEKLTIQEFLRKGNELPTDFLNLITPHINDLPTERDNFVWNYLKEHLNKELNMNGTNPKYIKRYSNFTHTDCVGISLNQSGINLLNSVNEDFIVVLTKYYRKIKTINCCLSQEVASKLGTDKTFILEQKALPEEFPLIDYSGPTIQKYCTEGMNPDNLPGKEMREKHGVSFLGLDKPEQQIHPCDHDSSYNKDTGLCNYSQKWCSHMGFSDIKTEYMPGITEKASYNNCEKGEGEEILGLLLPNIVIEEGVRATG